MQYLSYRLLILLCLIAIIGCHTHTENMLYSQQATKSKPRITVMRFDNAHSQPEMKGLESRIALNLQEQLQQTGRFIVVDTKDTNKTSKQVDYHITGSVLGDSMSTEIIVQFVRASTGDVEKTFKASGITTQSVIPIINELMTQIQNAFPLIGHIVRIQQDRIYTDLGNTDGVKNDDLFDIFSENIDTSSINKGKVTPTELVKLGQIQITEAQDKLSIAKLVNPQNEVDLALLLKPGVIIKKVEAQPKLEETMPSEQVIAILPFANHTQGKADWLGRTIGDALSTELSTLSNYHLVERQQLEQILSEQKLTASELFDPNSVVETGLLWKSRYIITGGYQKLGDKYRIDARRLDVQTSKIFEAQGLITTEDNLFETLQDLGKRLRESIDGSALRPDTKSQVEGILVKEKHLDEVPTSIYHLFPMLNINLVEYSLENTTGNSQHLIVTTQLLGYSQPQKEMVDIPSGDIKILYHTPAFLNEKLSPLLQMQEAGLELKIMALVNGKEQTIFQQTPTIQLLPRDTLLWRLNTPDNQSIGLLPAIASWVSSDSPVVAQVLREAVEYSTHGGIFGYQKNFLTGKTAESSTEEKKSAIREQVKAIYQALQDKHNIRYVDQSTQYPSEKGQRILHPSDVLKYKSANCIDGVVLFASLLYRAGIDPIIVIVPGHAFLGWKVWNNVDEYEFLETTKLGVADFETALDSGKEQAQKAFNIESFQRFSFDLEGQLKMGEAVLLDVKTLKEHGRFTEIPILGSL